jgi:hypothetical protein
MEQISLFNTSNAPAQINLTYFPRENGLRAEDLGEAILGMRLCLKEAASIASLDYDNIYVLPIQQGSVRTVFVYVIENPWKVIVTLDLIANLLNNSVGLIQHFGIDRIKNPDPEVLGSITQKGVLELCQSKDYRIGVQGIVTPLNELNEKAEITISRERITITCDNKYKFYEDETEVILPELVNGEAVNLRGEVYRINKSSNDIGFLYKGKSLKVIPMDPEVGVSNYHEFLRNEEVMLSGIVVRDSLHETPRIRLTEISNVADNSQESFFNLETNDDK